MPTFLEQKMAAVEAAQKKRKRARLLAVAAIALFAAAPATGQLWLAALGLAALAASAVMTLRSRSRTPTASQPAATAASGAKVAGGTTELPTHALPEPAGRERREAVGCTLDLKKPVRLRTADGGSVRLETGSHEARFRLTHPPERPTEDDAIDYPHCELAVRDEEGSWWRTETYVDPDLFTRPLEKPDRPILFWEHAPDPWKSALAESCVLADVRQLLDSRDRIDLPVGDRTVKMMFKYQGPRLDLGWVEDERRLVVRASGMYYEIWDEGEFRDIVDRVTFAYLLDPSEVLPLTAPDAHWPTWGAWEEDAGDGPPEPVFERTPRA